jgi:hypothetical protein
MTSSMMSSTASRDITVTGDLGHGGENGGHQRDEHDAGNSLRGGTTTNEDGRRPATNSEGGKVLVDDGSGFSATSSGNGGVDGLLLGAAMPREVAAQVGDEATARGGWSGCRRWTEKTNAATTLQATVERGRGASRKRRGRGLYL